MINFSPSRLLKLAVATVAFASHAAFAAPVNISGSLTASDPVFNRPVSTSALSSVGTAVSYDRFGFHVSAAGTYSFEALSFSASGADTFVALYRNTFNPASPLTNLLLVDDDSGAGALSLLSGPLQAGVQYFLIFTTFGNGVFGDYTGVFNTVTGSGQVVLDAAAVPEPGTLALLPLALAGIVLVRRRADRKSA